MDDDDDGLKKRDVHCWWGLGVMDFGCWFLFINLTIDVLGPESFPHPGNIDRKAQQLHFFPQTRIQKSRFLNLFLLFLLTFCVILSLAHIAINLSK